MSAPPASAAEVAADRDARHSEREGEVDDQQRQRAAAEHVGALALEHDRGAEDAEDRAGRADGDGGRAQRSAPRRAGEAGDEVEQEVADGPR